MPKHANNVFDFFLARSLLLMANGLWLSAFAMLNNKPKQP